MKRALLTWDFFSELCSYNILLYLDTTCNNMGTKLINFCKNSNLLIYNGRVGIDKRHGSVTNVKGKTIVDYLICSLNLLPCITHFCINTLMKCSQIYIVLCLAHFIVNMY